MTTAYTYRRVSTQHQAEFGLGLEAQDHANRAYCEARGWPVAGDFVDEGISGRKGVGKRPGLRAAIDAVRGTAGAVLVVYSLSRLARSQELVWTLLGQSMGYGLPVYSATEGFDLTTPHGRLIVGILAATSQYEADVTGERISATLKVAKGRGTRLGAMSMIESFVDGARVVDPVKVERVREVHDRVYARMPPTAIADNLNARGIPSPLGKRWHRTSVARALKVRLPAP